ncbi:MAG: RIO1 family regulatory kinase/ATPase, partial [Candidatus Thorarchaeota archaeon]
MEIAHLLPTLEKEDFRILMAIEIGMRRSKFVTIKNIKFYSRYKMEETLFRLNRVHKLDLIIRDASKFKVAYTLNSKAYDLLALHTLVEKNVISQLGPLIGKGKESDVYSCIDDDENIFAAKFYRMGRTSFRGIKKYRDLLGDRSHFSWLYVNRLAAKKEFEALEKIYTLKLNTPKPVDYNRHVVIMSYLRGKELVYYKSIKKPQKIFNRIIKQMKTIFQKVGMIHGDLGEFNIV